MAMKNLYKKGKVHPSPPLSTTGHHLSLLPATILVLTAALSPEDKEVLAYLISCGGTSSSSTSSSSSNFTGNSYRKTTATHKRSDHGSGGDDHTPMFECNCFRCYMSFWARWDNSPNRQVIHEIIDAYEEDLFQQKKKTTTRTTVNKRKDRGNKRRASDDSRLDVGNRRTHDDRRPIKNELNQSKSTAAPSKQNNNQEVHDQVDLEKGTARTIMSFVGEKIWGIWS